MSGLAFEFDFSPADHGSAEERATTADLRISVNGEVATRVDDTWARSVRDRVRVSCYPLACWLADSWWRLLHEAPSTRGGQPPGWRQSHQLVAAGAGYLWPRLTFLPDGETIDLEVRASLPAVAEPLRYLSTFRATVEASDAERELARFISSVVARLDAVGVPRTDLHDLWDDVQAERADATQARHRELEAELGFDADESPEGLVASLTQLESRAGPAAVEEIANAAGAARSREPNPIAFVQGVEALAHQPGMVGRFDAALAGFAQGSAGSRPWQRGRSLANQLRTALGLRGPVSDGVLEQLLGGHFQRAVAAGPVGLAVRSADQQVSVHFRRTFPTARRFEAARFVGELVLAGPGERWLTTTDAATAKQKAQRAFAAEFLVPITELAERLGGDYSTDELEAVAEDYRVSPLTVSSHLANNGLVAPDEVRR